jgi:hypothetical protein
LHYAGEALAAFRKTNLYAVDKYIDRAKKIA